jgi:hypothetical protein
MSLDGQGMICQACSITAQAVQQKAGMWKAYLTGAVIVFAFLAIVVARVVLFHIR